MTAPLLLLCTRRPELALRLRDVMDGTVIVVRPESLKSELQPGRVILVDLERGALDGGVVSALRCEPDGLKTPVIALVGDEAAARDAHGAGATDFLFLDRLEEELPLRLDGLRRALALREELASREDDLRRLVELTRAFAGSLEPAELLPEVTARLTRSLGLLRASIVLTQGETGKVLASSDEEGLGIRDLDLGKYPEIREAVRTRKPVIVEEADRHPLLDPVKEWVAAAGAGAMAVLPLQLETETFGVLFLRAPARRTFTPRELDFAGAVANATAVALRNARSVEELRNRGREAEALARELRRYESIFEHASDAILVLDAATGVVLSSNPAARELFGALDGTAEVLLRPDDPARFRALIRRAAAGEVIRSAELRAGALELSAGASKLREGLVLLALRDLTEQRRTEAELAQVRMSLAEAEERALLAELAGAAAHELNQPLTSIVGYAELLARRIADEDPNGKHVRIVLREAERMAAIVKKIGRITRRETRPYVGGSRILDLDRASEDA